jgi:hypothetical protein
VSSSNLKALQGIAANPVTLPTESELETRAAIRQGEFAADVPYRFGFIDKDIEAQRQKLQGRESSNINEALIQAGLGIMGSKSPRFLGAVSEGGLSAFRAYKEGLKDIRESERALMQSQIKSAEAQNLYDKDKYAAGDKARSQSLEYAKASADLGSTQSANIARVIQGEATLAREARETATLPYAIAESKARAAGYGLRSGISDADQKAAEDYASRVLGMKGIMPGSPEYLSAYQTAYQQYLASIRNPGVAPAVPVAQSGTGAKFVGFEK